MDRHALMDRLMPRMAESDFNRAVKVVLAAGVGAGPNTMKRTFFDGSRLGGKYADNCKFCAFSR
jgi:hypothetical protein